jgi:putative GTP pyrophosphokinase
MVVPENQDVYKADVDAVLLEFDGKKDMLVAFCAKTKTLIEECLQDATIRYQSVQARVKKRDKLREKYLDPAKSYKALNEITDQAALRVITYYEDEVDKVAEVIKREFDIDAENSVDKRDTEPDKFGYYALNYVCTHLKRRTSDVEYKKFCAVQFEIQVTSVLRHAWSEIEHPWYDLKGAFPDTIKRRFARMAALLEIAESEFLSLRKLLSDHKSALDVQVTANVPDIRIDVASLRSFIEQDPLVAKIDEELAAIMGLPISESLPDSSVESSLRDTKAVGITKLEELRRYLWTYHAAIPEFVDRCRKEIWPPPPSRPNSHINRGICIFHMAQIMVGSRRKGDTVEFLKARGLRAVTWNVARQEEIAEEASTEDRP